MNISESDKMALCKIGVQINGQRLIIEDPSSRMIHELNLEDIAQLIIRPSLRISKKLRELRISTLIICKWDYSRIKLEINKLDVKAIKAVLTRLNAFFYSDS